MDGLTPENSKDEVRAAVIRRRRAISANEHQSEAFDIQRHLLEIGRLGEGQAITTVCAYLPIGTEPGSQAMLDALLTLGLRVLLPVTRADQPLFWGDYRPDALVDAAFGLREPAAPHLEPAAIRLAQVVLIPALAVDRSGVRLGRGAGFYDRSLHLAAPDARLVAVVRDEELVPHLPAEAHDVPMTHALTPGAGLVVLGA
jgi:5-formyltetrahydrofolate cyclo-ligase